MKFNDVIAAPVAMLLGCFASVQSDAATPGFRERVRNVHLPEEYHDFGQSKRRALYAFFSEHLKMPHLPEVLDAMVVEPPSRMEVFNDAHPLPPHAIQDADAVRRVLRSLPRPISAR